VGGYFTESDCLLLKRDDCSSRRHQYDAACRGMQIDEGLDQRDMLIDAFGSRMCTEVL
jgi:hypothetical protein